MAMSKWVFDTKNVRMIAVDYTKDLDALTLRTARSTDDASNVFDPTSELGDLWLTLQGQKMNVLSANLMLFGDKVNPDTGKTDIIEAGILNKAETFGYAYTAKQIAAYMPVNLFMLSGRFHQPVLSASLVPYVARTRSRTRPTVAKPAIIRLTAAPVTPAAPPIKRVRS